MGLAIFCFLSRKASFPCLLQNETCSNPVSQCKITITWLQQRENPSWPENLGSRLVDWQLGSFQLSSHVELWLHHYWFFTGKLLRGWQCQPKHQRTLISRAFSKHLSQTCLLLKSLGCLFLCLYRDEHLQCRPGLVILRNLRKTGRRPGYPECFTAPLSRHWEHFLCLGGHLGADLTGKRSLLCCSNKIIWAFFFRWCYSRPPWLVKARVCVLPGGGS